MSTTSSLRKAIKVWYEANKRDLPWRHTRDPYRIWLSEVILQQTRVEQGRSYWEKFTERYPKVSDLAKAPEDEILKLWQGLGYYSRARNLRSAAVQVMEQHGGQFPKDMAGLKSLKGVGDYTAAAIASICFDVPEAVVDGNVYRVLARIRGVSTPIDSSEGRWEFKELARTLLDGEHPGDHNQAMMELGATVCTPRAPKCNECPAYSACSARMEGMIDLLPVKAGRTKFRVRHFNYLFISCKDGFFIQKRTGKDIWQNLYELPLIESDRPLSLGRLKAEISHDGIKKSGPVRQHILSHQKIEAAFWELKGAIEERPGWIAVTFADLKDYALPRLLDRWLTERSEMEQPHR